jgi:hypothetical protein
MPDSPNLREDAMQKVRSRVSRIAQVFFFATALAIARPAAAACPDIIGVEFEDHDFTVYLFRDPELDHGTHGVFRGQFSYDGQSYAMSMDFDCATGEVIAWYFMPIES